MKPRFNKLKKYLKYYYLIEEKIFDDYNIYIFDECGYYLVVCCDKENTVISDIVSEYY